MIDVPTLLTIVTLVASSIIYFNNKISELEKQLRKSGVQNTENIESDIENIKSQINLFQKEFDEKKLIDRHNLLIVNNRIDSLKANSLNSAKILIKKVNDLENYLHENHSYKRRSMSKIDKSSFDTITNGDTNDDDDWNTGIFNQ